jgi:hypothetical protein
VALDIEQRLRGAVQSYWDARGKNKEKQLQSGKIDAGTRGEVTGGTQMGGLEVPSPVTGHSHIAVVSLVTSPEGLRTGRRRITTHPCCQRPASSPS